MSFELNDCLKAKSLDTFTLTNQFETVKNTVKHQMGLNDYCYVGLFLGFDNVTGHPDLHFVHLLSLIKNNSNTFKVTDNNTAQGDIKSALANFSCDVRDDDQSLYHPWGINNNPGWDSDSGKFSLFGIAEQDESKIDGSENEYLYTLKYKTIDHSGLSYEYNQD